MFISHARTPEELRAEVISFLQQRRDSNESYSQAVARNASEKARLAAVTIELDGLIRFFSELNIVRPIRKRNKGQTTHETNEVVAGGATVVADANDTVSGIRGRPGDDIIKDSTTSAGDKPFGDIFPYFKTKTTGDGNQ